MNRNVFADMDALDVPVVGKILVGNCGTVDVNVSPSIVVVEYYLAVFVGGGECVDGSFYARRIDGSVVSECVGCWSGNCSGSAAHCCGY